MAAFKFEKKPPKTSNNNSTHQQQYENKPKTWTKRKAERTKSESSVGWHPRFAFCKFYGFSYRNKYAAIHATEWILNLSNKNKISSNSPSFEKRKSAEKGEGYIQTVQVLSTGHPNLRGVFLCLNTVFFKWIRTLETVGSYTYRHFKEVIKHRKNNEWPIRKTADRSLFKHGYKIKSGI